MNALPQHRVCPLFVIVFSSIAGLIAPAQPSACAQTNAPAVPLASSSGGDDLTRGLRAIDEKDYSRALTLLTAAVNEKDSRTGLAEAFACRASLWCKLHQYDKARADFNAAIRASPYSASTYARAGAEAFRAGRDSDAQSFYRRGLETSHVSDQLRNDYAWFLATSPEASFRNGAQAAALALHACNGTRWNNSWFIDTLAAAEAEQGEFDAAQKYEQQALLSKKLTGDTRVHAEARLRGYQHHQRFHERPTE